MLLDTEGPSRPPAAGDCRHVNTTREQAEQRPILDTEADSRRADLALAPSD
jgi:hypothetical protein